MKLVTKWKKKGYEKLKKEPNLTSTIYKKVLYNWEDAKRAFLKLDIQLMMHIKKIKNMQLVKQGIKQLSLLRHQALSSLFPEKKLFSMQFATVFSSEWSKGLNR